MQRIYKQVLDLALLQKVLILNFAASLFFFFSVIGPIIRKKRISHFPWVLMRKAMALLLATLK